MFVCVCQREDIVCVCERERKCGRERHAPATMPFPMPLVSVTVMPWYAWSSLLGPPFSSGLWRSRESVCM